MPIFQLDKDIYLFPKPSLSTKDGLLAIGGDLKPERLINAYASGIFPWYNQDEPILWWSPNPRLVLFPKDIKISKSLFREIKANKFTIKFDNDFEDVIRKCSNSNRKDELGTWITEEMCQAYINLFNIGLAHSIETYFENKLVGGLYGVSFGKAFFGESMFYEKNNASKIAFITLCKWLQNNDFHFIDCQVKTSHLISLGAKEVSRREYLKMLNIAIKQSTMFGKWIK